MAKMFLDVAVQAKDAVFPAVLSRCRCAIGPVVPLLVRVSSDLHPDHFHTAVYCPIPASRGMRATIQISWFGGLVALIRSLHAKGRGFDPYSCTF